MMLVASLVCVAFLSIPGLCNTDFEKSLENIKEHLDALAEKAFDMAEASKPVVNENSLPNNRRFHYHHSSKQSRKYASELARKISCFSRGMQLTKNLVLERLNMPKDMEASAALERVGSLSQDTCRRLAHKCDVEDLLEMSSLHHGGGGGGGSGGHHHSPPPPSSNNWFTNNYRTYDGSNNNPHYSNFGLAGSVFDRFINPPRYQGTDCQPLSGLPNPRSISNTMNDRSTPAPNNRLTLMAMQWGQFIDHDLTFTPEVDGVTNCCESFSQPTGTPSHECIKIDVPTRDPFYSSFSQVQCLPLVRSESGPVSCNIASQQYRQQINSLTSWIDASQVYGSSIAEVAALREGNTHLLKVSNDLETSLTGSCGISSGYTAFLPPSSTDPSHFVAGDVRVNEQPGLTSLHTVFVRYHNRIANLLKSKFPGYSDDTYFEETRRRVGATMQVITYREFLPVIFDSYTRKYFGLDFMGKFRPSNINPVITNSFATAAFRFGHTMVGPDMGFTLRDHFDDPTILRNAATTPTKILGAESSNNAQEFDAVLHEDITNFLFKTSPNQFGQDLYARNIMRGRDHGLGSFNDYRRFFGYYPFNSNNINIYTRPGEGAKLAAAYNGNYENIELFPGGLAELPDPNRPGDMLGPTFTNIIGYQFFKIKYGDHFWVEANQFKSSELDAILRTTLGEILCETTCLQSVQDRALEEVSKNNPLYSCSSFRSNSRKTLINYLEEL